MPLNLWPTNTRITPIQSPLSFIEDQATLVSKNTRGFLIGKVELDADNSLGLNTTYKFLVTNRKSESATLFLFGFNQASMDYPVTIKTDLLIDNQNWNSIVIPDQLIDIYNKNRLIAILSQIFSSKTTQEVFKTLGFESTTILI